MIPLIPIIILMCAGAVLLFFFLKEKVKAYSVKAVMFKAAASICFVGVAAVSLFAKGYHALSIFVTLGLFFGVLGDIWLDFKYVFKEHDKIFTYAGFIMFASGHACYISGMFLEFFNNQNPLYIILPLIGGLLISVCNLFIAKPMKLDYSGYKVISNVEGNNMETGILSVLIKNCSLTGKISADYFVFETDESYVPVLYKMIPLDCLVVLDFFRDQLDRVGEVETVIQKING